MRAAALLILSAAVAPTWLRAQASSWTGCYDLEIGSWSRPVGGDSLYYSPPGRIRLDSLPAEGHFSDPTGYRVHPAPGSPPSIHDHVSWKPTGADSIVISWSTGFSGLQARMIREESLLRGQASTFTDVIPFEPRTADVIARPVPCDAPMSPEKAVWRRFPREVPLQTGDTLTLGEPLPSGSLALEHYRSNTYWVRHRPEGLFVGASHARVGRDSEGRVRKIELFFDPQLGLEALEARLASALGPPTSRSARGADTAVYWFGREGHRFSLLRYLTVEGEEHLVIMIMR